MTHPDNGELRRMLDEPEAVNDGVRRHVEECESCRAHVALLRSDADSAKALLSGNVAVDTARAYERVRVHASAHERRNYYAPLSALATAAAFAAALIFTPLGGYASSLLTIFEPTHFVPIQVSRTDLRSLHLLPQADDVGTQRVVAKPQKHVFDSIAQAQKQAGFALRTPSALPSGFGVVRSFFGYTPGEMTFTFNAAKARAFVHRSHKQLPPMPPSLDGTTVRVKTGYAFNAHYEAPRSRYFELVEVQAPRVTSTGASLDTLEKYLLSLPNVTPELAKQIRALGDIRNTVPVPVQIDKQTAQHVSIDGADGLAIGDNTGLGAGVMWEKNGILYVVAGPVTMDDVMTVAHGLK